MAGKLQNDSIISGWRNRAIFMLMIIMMAALFFSRSALSAAIMLFVAISFLHRNFKKQVLVFFSSPQLWGMSLLFFLPLISGLWTGDKHEWTGMIRIKLPLLMMPLAFAAPFHFTKRQWEWLAYIFVGVLAGTSIWAMFSYLSNVHGINEAYLRAKTILTPLDNDHVRFSWLISVAAFISGWLCLTKRKTDKVVSIVFAVLFGWLFIFLHILAARTGLISLYIMVAVVLVWVLSKKITPLALSRKYIIFLLLALLAFPIIAYKTIPTFQNKIKYFLYDFEYSGKTHYLPGANDAVRVISIKAGWNVMNQHPLLGVGFGDILPETRKWYQGNYPQMLEDDKIYPSGEWLMYGAGCGWPGLLLFGFVMVIPFLIRTGSRLLWWLLNATAAFTLLFDIGLEVQFGVFIYSFIILWWWKWLAPEGNGY